LLSSLNAFRVKHMPNYARNTDRIVSAKWELPKPSPLWAWWLQRGRLDGDEFRRWQSWIKYSRRKKSRNWLVHVIRVVREIVEAPIEVLGGLKISGKKTNSAYGVSLLTQYWQLLVLRWRFGIRPESYYKYMMFKPERFHAARYFVTETSPPLAAIIRRAPKSEDEKCFVDKNAFWRWCTANNLPTVSNLMEIEGGKIVAQHEAALAGVDLFVKPRNGDWGIGVSRWRFEKTALMHRYLDSHGRAFSEPDLVNWLCQRSKDLATPYIVQPLLANHRELRGYTNGALATIRLMTIRASREPAQPLVAALRMPTGDALIDNFGSGGVGAPINLVTGKCGPGLRMTESYPPDEISLHPDTGLKIADLTIPCWPECVDLVLRAHDLVEARVPLVGWDVAVVGDGPVLIEANHLPGEEIAQMPAGFPMGASDFARVVCTCLREEFFACSSRG
jgi:hypothetical protein